MRLHCGVEKWNLRGATVRRLTGRVAMSLSRDKCDAYWATARPDETARNCEIFVPPGKSSTKVKSAIAAILAR
jgi:hypothetical protein